MSKLRCRHVAILAFVGAVGCDADSGKPELLAPGSGTASFSASHPGDGDPNQFSGNDKIAMRDDCDPRDPAWLPTGGCMLRRGDVTFAEFNAEMNSPLAASVIGHLAWTNDPSYLQVDTRRTVRVTNEGGRVHTFTEVAMFGGGRVPVPTLNKGLVTAPECLRAQNVPPGGSIEISGLSPGNHRFQCCIHPWMRTLIKVSAGDHGGHGNH